MAFIEKLKGIIPPSLYTSAFHYDIKLDFDTSKKSKVLYKVDSENKVIHIYVHRLNSRQEKVLKTVFSDTFKEGSLCFISEKSTPLLEKLYKYNHEANSEDLRTLAFFKPVLSKSDWEALRDSLFLRDEFNKGFNVTQLKNSIVSRYGERGNIISNMCTAGYFEEVMIPIYNSSSVEFYKYWDIAIDRGIVALFVNAGMTQTKIKDEIKRRLNSAKAYGLSSIHIHGIGAKNIKNIKDCIEKEKNNLGFTEKKLFTVEDRDLKILVVEILL